MADNPNDPLLKAGPDQQRILFDRLRTAANGFSTEDVIGACAQIIINALRQAHPTRQSVEPRFNEIFGKMKQLLLDHYDQLGRKRGIFPFNQTISMPRYDDNLKKNII